MPINCVAHTIVAVAVSRLHLQLLPIQLFVLRLVQIRNSFDLLLILIDCISAATSYESQLKSVPY